jgi:CheY-like chemotaxis protein
VYTILLIEGDPEARSRAKRAFSTGAPHVRLCVVNGSVEGLAYLSGVGAYTDRVAYPIPQLVLLDLDLPERGAFDVLYWTQAKPPLERIPMIVRSSRGASAEIEEARALGATACLPKHDAKLGISGFAKKNRDAGGSRTLTWRERARSESHPTVS